MFKCYSTLVKREYGSRGIKPVIPGGVPRLLNGNSWDSSSNEAGVLAITCHGLTPTFTGGRFSDPHGSSIVVPFPPDILKITTSYKIETHKRMKENVSNTLNERLPALSEAKLKERVFVEPDVRKLMKNENFEPKMATNERKGRNF
ncbi:hypothetical protein AVEN_245378-1 [Araneus ventricosus]|uniref:Uncharacterized protein n=1 Tax=Araneus ventricosus TaxID=182803 RepID=A0A4Y2JYE5_ARAVE|nr:hypothetical protein AVEN_245378-1 [Araneus ventricosus]